MEHEFNEDAHRLTASFSCLGDPGPLKSGGRGWFQRSTPLEWHFGWRFCAQCSVTVPKDDYGIVRPPPGTREFNLGMMGDQAPPPYEIGRLVIADRSVEASVFVPDCLRLDHGKFYFSWSQPILIGEAIFHCSFLVETVGPKDGSYLQVRKATRDSAGGLDFMSSSDEVIGRAHDSETVKGKGRCERILAMRTEAGIEGPVLSAKAFKAWLVSGREILSFRSWIEEDPRLAEFDEYVTTHPSLG